MKIFPTIFLPIPVGLIAGHATPAPPQTVAGVTGLKPDQAARHEYRHAHAWPGVNKLIKDCHIQNYSIPECQINGRPDPLACPEYTGINFSADMARMAADPETPRWWTETASCQSRLPDAVAKGKTWPDAKEIYFLP
jgi:L-rhamnose mutarotase